MGELVLKDVSLNINGFQLVNKKSLAVEGLCCLSVSSTSGNLKEILLLFSLPHVSANNDIKIDGLAILNDRVMPASKIHYLLNRNMVFECNDTVENVLTTLNKLEAMNVIERLEMNFHKKRLCQLNCTESRIFEIAVNMVTNPFVMYIKKLLMADKDKIRILDALKEYSILTGCIILVETDYNPIFDSAVVIGHEKIVSLNREESKSFFASLRVRPYSLPRSSNGLCEEYPEIKIESSLVEKLEPFDYKGLYKENKTESLIDIKHKYIPIFEKILNPGIYRINFKQAVQIAYRKYEISFQRFDQKLSICKSMFPVIFAVLIARLFPILSDYSLIKYIPEFICKCIYTFFNTEELIYLPIYFFQTFVVKHFSICRILFLLNHFWRSEIQGSGYIFMFASIFFSIIYHYSFIFEEELQFLNYHMNVLFTPGTFIMSIFIYILMAHFSTFMVVGLVLNVKMVGISVLTVSFVNLFYCSFTGRRLRSSLLGVAISIFLHIIIADLTRTKLSFLKYLYMTILPCFSSYDSKENYVSSLVLSDKTGIYFYCYCIVAYVCCCYSLSSL